MLLELGFPVGAAECDDVIASAEELQGQAKSGEGGAVDGEKLDIVRLTLRIRYLLPL